MEFCLWRFDHDVLNNGATGPDRPPLNLCEMQALRVGNHMLYLIDPHGFKHRYYCPRDPESPISILPHHVCCLYGTMANMLCGNRSIWSMMYSTTEYFDTVGPVKESMPQDGLQDLIRCMYFADDWNDDREDGWDTFYMDKKEGLKAGTAQHWMKFSIREDAYNAR